MHRENNIFRLLKIAGLALFLAVVMDHFFIGFAVVQGGSMEPTISGQDRLIIAKLDYLIEPVEIGDIIIFNPPFTHSNLFVKRVVAKEKDQFEIKDGIFYLNGQPLEEAYLGYQAASDRNYALTKGVVPDGMVFVLGDNRNDSNDSRSFGYISENEIKGKVLFRVWPFDAAKTFVGAGD